MLNFFAIVFFIFIGLLVIVLKKRNFKKFTSSSNSYSNQLKKKRKNNIKFISNKNIFYYEHGEKKYTAFYKNSQRKKMLSLFQGNTEDKLVALKIAEQLADKSTLPILRKGLKDTSSEVIEISALLIRKFK